LQSNNFTLSQRRSSIVAAVAVVVLLLVFGHAQQPFSLLQQQREAIAQQQSEQATRQKVPSGAAADSNFTDYTNPQYGFSLLYPSSWVNKEIGTNLTFLMSFSPPASEFGEFVFVYMAVKNLTDKNTSLKQFTDQEISLLKRPPAATSPTEDTSARTILESEPTTIAGNTSAHKVVYTEKVSGTLSKIMEIYAVNEDKGYIMTYLAFTDIYEKYLPTAQKMAGSLDVAA
jgi:hypothetical protein